jgi:hypothetical protein
MSPPAVGVCAGTNCGSLLRFDSSAAVDDCSSIASSAVTIGVVELKSWRWMREPVTTILPSSSALAHADSADRVAIRTVLRRSRSRHGERAGATRQQKGLIDAHIRLTPHFVLPSQKWRPAVSRR